VVIALRRHELRRGRDVVQLLLAVALKEAFDIEVRAAVAEAVINVFVVEAVFYSQAVQL
jgi:hypothetical protein